MRLRTKGEQKAYLDGYEKCAESIEKYLSDESKKKLKCLLTAVRSAIEIEDEAVIVNICGIPHKVIECEDNFNVDAHFGQIDYKACEIRINKGMPQEIRDEALCHEMVHGIFVHLGYNDYAQDEHLVQVLGNAIYQGFNIKAESEDK